MARLALDQLVAMITVSRFGPGVSSEWSLDEWYGNSGGQFDDSKLRANVADMGVAKVSFEGRICLQSFQTAKRYIFRSFAPMLTTTVIAPPAVTILLSASRTLMLFKRCSN